MVLYILLFVPIDVSYVGRNGISILAVTLIAMHSIVWYMRFLGVYFLLVHNPCVCFRINIHYYGLAKYIEFCSFILLAGSGTRLESERSAYSLCSFGSFHLHVVECKYINQFRENRTLN